MFPREDLTSDENDESNRKESNKTAVNDEINETSLMDKKEQHESNKKAIDESNETATEETNQVISEPFDTDETNKITLTDESNKTTSEESTTLAESKDLAESNISSTTDESSKAPFLSAEPTLALEQETTFEKPLLPLVKESDSLEIVSSIPDVFDERLKVIEELWETENQYNVDLDVLVNV